MCHFLNKYVILLEIEDFNMEEEKKELEAQEVLKEEPAEEVEAPVEEKPVENKEKENDSLPGANFIKPIDDERSYVNIIEDARLAFNKRYSKSRTVSYILMAVVLVIAVGSVILTTRNEMALKITGWALIGSAIIGMLVFYVVTRNKLPELTKEYIKLVNETMNGHNFTDAHIKEASTDEKEKIELAECSCDGIYKDLAQIASRNVVRGKYEGKSFVVSDLGLYNNGTGKNRSSAFVGKYISMQNSLHFEGHYIITVKGDNPVDLPTDIEGMDIKEDGNLIIYGPKDGNMEKALGKKVLPIIKKLTINETLMNVNFVFWAGHSAAYLSYCDEIMTLPFQKPFTGKDNDIYRSDLYTALEALEILNK